MRVSKYMVPVACLIGFGCGDDAGNDLQSPQDAGLAVDGGASPDGGRPGRSVFDGTLLELALAQGLTAFVDTATSTGLDQALSGAGPLTVFAPSNPAFERFRFDAPQASGLLTNILLGHVVQGELELASLREAGQAQTLAKTTIRIDPNLVGEARVGDRTDLFANNGVLNVTTDVLPSLPLGDFAEARPDLRGFGAVTSSASTVAVDPLFGEGPLTLFVPSDLGLIGADLSAPDQILGTHWAEGQRLARDLVDGLEITMSNGVVARVEVEGGVTSIVTELTRARVVETDVRLANGVVHIIDRVLASNLEDGDIMQILRREGLTSLVTALEQTGVALNLQARGPLTLFAPTNEAIRSAAGLPADRTLLANILLHHVLDSRVDGASLLPGRPLVTQANTELPVTRGRNGADVGGANLVGDRTDIEATNGLVHVVDTVILPPRVLDTIQTRPEYSALGGLTVDRDRAFLRGFLSRTGVTLFAPTNESLGRVDTSTLTDAQVQRLIEYHLVTGAQTLNSLAGTRLQTVSRDRLGVRQERDGSLVLLDESGSTVRFVPNRTDLRLRDGIIHAIEDVLSPVDE